MACSVQEMGIKDYSLEPKDEDYPYPATGPSEDGDYSNSRPMREEDLIDSLFFTCDVDRIGKVPIKRLVEYLKITTSNISENDEDLKNLAALLDVNGTDSTIDLQKYRIAMKNWIKNIRIQSSFGEDNDDVFSSDVCSTPPCAVNRDTQSPSVMTTPTYQSGVISNVGEQEQMELQSLVDGLQHQNRRLGEDNAKLQCQLDTQDDNLTASVNETNKLTRKIKSLQEIVDLKYELQTENEEMRCTVSRLQERRKELENRLTQLEREKSLCESRNKEMEHKVQTLSGQVDSLSSQKQELHTSNVENKHRLAQILEVKTMQEIHLNERFNEVKALQCQLKLMSKTMEELRQEKDAAQLQCSQVQQEISSIQAKTEESFSFHEQSSLASEEGMPSKLPLLYSCSTPIKTCQSICMELKEMAMRDRSTRLVPTPLCAKEYFEEVLADITPLLDCEEDEDEEDYDFGLEEDISASSKDDLTMEISKFADKYTEKQTKLLQEIDSYIKVEGQHTDNQMAEVFHKNLKSELDRMLQKVSTLAKAKELVDNRVTSLKSKLKKVMDEHQQLKLAHQKSRLLLTRTGVDLDLSMDNRLKVMKEALDKERSYISMLEKELAEKNQMINNAGNIQDGNMSSLSREDLLHEIDQLKRENLDLEEKCHKTEVKIVDLEDALGRNQDELDSRKTQCDDLEENLSSCKLERQLDLKEIWRLVHKDVEKECTEDQKEVSLSEIPDNIRDQISHEIKSLKTQLHKREAALDLLTSSKSTPDHKSLEHSTCSCFGNFSGSNASSPLVEALTIDFFNGNQPLQRGRKGPDIASSEMDLLSGCSKCGDQLYNGWGYTPLDSHRQPQRQTSTESNNTNLCKSVSSSSTSGAADLDLSTSTLKSSDGRSRRKEFQSIRWESDDIVYQSSSSSFDNQPSHSDVERTVDHNDNTTCDLLVPANGLRRLSFNAAIANQNYASDDMVHYPRCRSQSFQAAIESGQRTPGDHKDPLADFSKLSGNKNSMHSTCLCGDNFGSCAKCNTRNKQSGLHEVKKHNDFHDMSKHNGLTDKGQQNVMSCEEEEDRPPTGSVDCWNDNLDQNCHSSHSFSHISYPTECRDTAKDCRNSPHLTRKLSILVEEEDSVSDAESQRSPLQTALKHKLTNGQIKEIVDSPPASYRTHYIPNEDGAFVNISHHSSFGPPTQENIQQTGHLPTSTEKELSWQDTEKEKLKLSPLPLQQCRPDIPQGPVEPLHRGTPPRYSHRDTSPRRHDGPDQGGVTEDDEQNVSITSALALHLEKLSLSDGMNNSKMSTKSPASSQSLNNRTSPNLHQPLTPSSSQSLSRSSNTRQPINHRSPGYSPSMRQRESPVIKEEPDHSATMTGSSNDRRPAVTQGNTDQRPAVTQGNTDQRPAVTQANTDQRPAVIQARTDHQVNDEMSSLSEDVDIQAKNSKLAKIRQDHLNKKRDQMKHVKMPELMETQEAGNSVNGTGPQTNDTVLKPPPPNDQPAFPSIPNSFLQKLKLTADTVNGKDGSEQANELEIENKFTSLSLAFKTDKLTLEKRLEIQERSRDIAEQNVDKELKGLRDHLETLNELCLDRQIRDLLRKIQSHLDIMEQAAARVSSRAEVYGAVQQEKRMSKAIEIMITHVDTIRMVHERVSNELEEARKMLQDSRPFGSTGMDMGDFPHISKRSASLSQQGQGFQSRIKGRRVSEVAIPRALGGTGAPSLTHSASMDASISLECKQPTWLRKDSPDSEDAKSRFQLAVASMTMKNVVSDTFRRGSATLSKQSAVSITPPSSRENSTESKGKDTPEKTLSKQNSKEEEAFQKGFQQGYKAQMGRELSSLREHQNSINHNLDELMDSYDNPPEEEQRTLKEILIEKVWDMVPEWEIAGKRLRMGLAGLVFFMALCSIVMSFLPLGNALQVFPEYRHMDHPPL